MNRTEKTLEIIVKKLRSKGFDANSIIEENESISLVVNAYIDTVKCSVMCWLVDQHIKNWRSSYRLSDDSRTMVFKFNHRYPLNAVDIHNLFTSACYAIKCVPYATDNATNKEEETDMITFDDVVKALEEKGYAAFEESKENAVYIIMGNDEAKKWYTVPECIGISTETSDDESKYCKFVIRIKPGYDVNEETMNLLMEFAEDMPAKSRSVNTKQEEAKRVITLQEVINALRKKGYNAYAHKNSIYIYNAGTKDKVNDWLNKIPKTNNFNVVAPSYPERYFDLLDLVITYNNDNVLERNAELMEFIGTMPSIDELNSDSANTDSNISIATIVQALRQKGYSASVCDEKSFYVSRNDMAKAPNLPTGWVIDVASSSWLAAHVINYDITDDSLKELVQWVEQIPHGIFTFASKNCNAAFNHNSFNSRIDDFDNSSMYPRMPMIQHTIPNTLLGRYLPSPISNTSILDDVITAICNEDGGLDANKAKELYGSCKKALKAVIYAYRYENIGTSYDEKRRSQFINQLSARCNSNTESNEDLSNKSQDFEQ